MNKHGLKRAIGWMILVIMIMIMLPAVLSFTAEYPKTVTDHYLDKKNIYWQIRQITISPIFDEPDTSIVELYFQQPAGLYLISAEQKILAIEDTVWTYLLKHNQIQKTIGGNVFNPFDFIDTSQTLYQVVESNDTEMILKSVDGTLEPDSLKIRFNSEGVIKSLVYLDANENEVLLEFLEESFKMMIPKDNFLANIPEGVEVIDISD